MALVCHQIADIFHALKYEFNRENIPIIRMLGEDVIAAFLLRLYSEGEQILFSRSHF